MPLIQQTFNDSEPDFPRPGEFMSETDFARAVGCEQPTISKLLANGILTPSADVRQWMKELYRYYSETAAGRRGDGPLDLVQERARLAQAQADKTNFELRKARGEFIPARLIFDAIANGYAIVRNRLLRLPNKFKSHFPQTETRHLVMLDSEIRAILTEMSQLRLSPEMARRLSAWEQNGKEIYSDEKNEAKDTQGKTASNRRKRTPTSKKTRRNSGAAIRTERTV